MQIGRALIYLLMVAAAMPAAAIASEESHPPLSPLSEFIRGRDFSKDSAALSYALIRCTGLYLAYAKYLEPETSPDRVEVRKRTLDVAGKLLIGAVDANMKGTTTKMEDAFAAAQVLGIKLTNAYLDHMSEIKTYAGDFSKDPLISGDQTVCRALVDAIPK